jgi:hypothetical protein
MHTDPSTHHDHCVEVRRLDAALNERLHTAADTAAAAHWWRVKVAIKRSLASLPEAEIPAAARVALHSVASESITV